MILIDDFFNELAGAIDKKYFPTVKYYRDNKDCADVHYAIELTNNGCMTYRKLINVLSKSCKVTREEMHEVVKPFVKDFGSFVYKP